MIISSALSADMEMYKGGVDLCADISMASHFPVKKKATYTILISLRYLQQIRQWQKENTRNRNLQWNERSDSLTV